MAHRLAQTARHLKSLSDSLRVRMRGKGTFTIPSVPAPVVVDLVLRHYEVHELVKSRIGSPIAAPQRKAQTPALLASGVA